MESWFHLTEEEYVICAESADMTERSSIVVQVFKPRSYFCESKLKILDELTYQVLEFGTVSNLSYASVRCLFHALSEELRAMSDHRMETETSTPRERFTAVVKCYRATIPPHELKKISQFYVDRLVGARSLLKYVIHSLPNEQEHVLHLEILTPAVLGPMTEATLMSSGALK